jgi:hypothetical protein
MPTVTLAESAKLAQDMLVAGVIETIVDVDPMFELLSFDPIDGNSIAYNRENAMGDVQVLGVGGTITAKAAATFTRVSSDLTTIIGDAEVNGLIQATRSGDGNDQKVTQIMSKAKNVGRTYRNLFINGTGAGNEFNGLINLVAAAQKITPATNGANLSFDTLDQLIDRVKAKDGQVDFFQMPLRTIRAYFGLLRALGGATINEVMQLPSGKTVPVYRGVPIFANDFIPTNQVQGSSGAVCTTIFAGCFDDGSRSNGISGLTASKSAGIQVVPIGESETKDESITRIKWYCGLASFSDLGLASAGGILN